MWLFLHKILLSNGDDKLLTSFVAKKAKPNFVDEVKVSGTKGTKESNHSVKIFSFFAQLFFVFAFRTSIVRIAARVFLLIQTSKSGKVKVASVIYLSVEQFFFPKKKIWAENKKKLFDIIEKNFTFV